MITSEKLQLVKETSAGCLVDYLYLKNLQMILAIDLNKQKVLIKINTED